MDNSNKNTGLSLEREYLRDTIHKNIKNLPIKQWDLGASCSSDSSVQVDNGDAKQMKSSQKSSITLRVWNREGTLGITSTSDLSESGLLKAINGAYQASRLGNPNEIPQFSSLAKDPLPKLERPVKDSIGIQNLFKLLKSAEAELLHSHKAIKTIPYNGLAEANYSRLYINSDDAYRHLNRSQSTLYLYARAEEEGRKPRSSGSIRVALGTTELDINGCIKEACRKTLSHLNYKPIETGKYLVCFKPEAFLELINSFGSMFNARSVLDGVSLTKKENLGELISVPFLNINDNCLHDANVGASSFDGEGTPTRNIPLIKAGVIENFIHSEATAREFGVKPTGHAGLGAKVSVGLDWLEIGKTPGKLTKKQTLNYKSQSERFILIEGLNALHAGVKASQGSFSLPFDGWLVDNGEKISIEAATIAGDIREVLRNILHIEDNQTITHHGICPHIWVSNLSITGEA